MNGIKTEDEKIMEKESNTVKIIGGGSNVIKHWIVTKEC